MTRDTKLALVVGFALVLAVGVLISDHFASGYRSPPADLVQPQSTVNVLQLAGDGRPARGAMAHQSERDSLDASITRPPAKAPTRAEKLDTPQAREILLATPEFLEIAQGPSAREMLPHERAGLGSPVSVLPLADLSVRNPSAVSIEREPDTARGSHKPALAVAKARWHTVREGESLWDICKLYYARGSVWPKLAKMNADRVSAKGVVREGVRLRIPEAVAMGLKARTLPAGPSLARADQTARSDSGGSKVATTSYTVVKNETLGQIASRLLGTVKRVDEIVALNKIADPNAIRAGMVLRVPKK